MYSAQIHSSGVNVALCETWVWENWGGVWWGGVAKKRFFAGLCVCVVCRGVL